MGDKYSHPVDRLSVEGLYSRYRAGSGQGVTVNINDLQENLSFNEIHGLDSRLSSLNLSDGKHTVSLSNLGAKFTGAENHTIGGHKVDVTVNVNVKDGKLSVTSGTWSQHKPDIYDFSPTWSEHRSLRGNLATLAERVFETITPPFSIFAEPFEITIKGSRQIDGTATFSKEPRCFLAGTEIDMWPVEAVGLTPDKDGKFDQDKVRAAIWKKPIEQIQTDDWVVSFSDDGLLIPGKVGQTFQNRSKHILDVPVPQFDEAGKPNGMVKSLMITPGHVTYCAKVEGEENPFAGRYVPIMDILRSDGALKMQDGTLVRAATGAVVGSFEDQKIAVIVGHLDDQGNLFKYDEGMIRIGTKFIKDDGEVFCVADMAKKNGMGVADNGLLVSMDTNHAQPFLWSFIPKLPKPEDYILQRSALTLEEVYEADEWESVRPQMPAPYAGEAGRSFKQEGTTLYASGATAANDHLPPNIPLSMRNSPNQPTMSRKQRRAHEAKMRKEAKTKKRAVGMVH